MKIIVALHQKYFLATKFRDGHATSFSSVTCATLIRFFCSDGDFLCFVPGGEMIIVPCPWNRFHVKFRLFVSCVFSLIIFVLWGRGGLARLDLSWSIDFCVLASSSLPQAPMTTTAPLSFSSGFMLSMFSDWQRLEENSSCNSVSSLPRWQRASSLLHIKTSRTTTKMNALVHICV